MKSFNYRQGTIEQLLKDRSAFEKLITCIDPDIVASQRWFRRKNLAITRIKLLQSFYIKPQSRDKIPFNINMIEIFYKDKTNETYFFPIAFSRDELPLHARFLKVFTKDAVFYTGDAVVFEPFIKFVNDCLKAKMIMKGASSGASSGSIVFEGAGAEIKPFCEEINTNSTNSLVRLSYKSILKIIRKVEEGINVEYEMGDFLTRNGFPFSPPVEGGITYISKQGRSSTLGIKFKELENSGDGWTYTISLILKYFDYFLSGNEDPKTLTAFLKDYLDDVSKLAHVIASLHSTMIRDKEHPRFRPEEFSETDLNQWEESFLNLIKRSVDDAQKYVLDHPDDSPEVGKLFIPVDLVKRSFERIKKGVSSIGNKTRIHCDLHLGQVLKTKNGFDIIDFEGEPLRPIEERAAKYSPLRDVAGMLRSFHYAAFSSYFKAKDGSNRDKLFNAASVWADIVSRHFTREYIESARKLRVSSVPYGNLPVVQKMLALYKLEKAVYELCYELNNRPEWVLIPIAGIKTCLAELESE